MRVTRSMSTRCGAMLEYTEEMGATRVVPGSHKLGGYLQLRQAETVPAEMTPGSAMIYSGKLSTVVARTSRRRYVVRWTSASRLGGCGKKGICICREG